MKKCVYKVIFLNQSKVYEIFARKINHGSMLGFIEVEELIFGERSGVLVDPSEEKLKGEFSGVTKFFVPLHSVIRIDEVEREGTSKIHAAGENVMPFPLYTTQPLDKK